MVLCRPQYHVEPSRTAMIKTIDALKANENIQFLDTFIDLIFETEKKLVDSLLMTESEQNDDDKYDQNH